MEEKIAEQITEMFNEKYVTLDSNPTCSILHYENGIYEAILHIENLIEECGLYQADLVCFFDDEGKPFTKLGIIPAIYRFPNYILVSEFLNPLVPYGYTLNRQYFLENGKATLVGGFTSKNIHYDENLAKRNVVIVENYNEVETIDNMQKYCLYSLYEGAPISKQYDSMQININSVTKGHKTIRAYSYKRPIHIAEIITSTQKYLGSKKELALYMRGMDFDGTLYPEFTIQLLENYQVETYQDTDNFNYEKAKQLIVKEADKEIRLRKKRER